MRTINQRLANEQRSYDGDVVVHHNAIRRRFSHVFECPAIVRVDRELDDLCARVMRDKDVLEIGCGYGRLMRKFVQYKPKRLAGVDFYEPFIERGKRELPEMEFHAMDAHRMAFPDASFDVVIGYSVLHHLEFERALHEMRRITKPGGYVIFSEPLRDNPAGKFFRLLTPKARTKDELPISRRQIEWADKLFASSDHRFEGLASTGLALLTSFTALGPDNVILRLADRADQWLAATPLRYWMRRAVLVWHKG